MVEDVLQWIETNNSTLLLDVIMENNTHWRYREFFHSICRDFNYVYANDKESNTWEKDVLYTGFWAVTNINPSIVLSASFLLMSFQADTNILEACVSANWLLTALEFHTVTSYTNSNTFWNICNRSKMNFFSSSTKFLHGEKYTPFWVRTQTFKHNTEHYLSGTSTVADKMLNYEELSLTW